MNVLMLYPKFPEQTFWNTARSVKLLWGRKAIMPPLGLLIGGVDFSNFFVTLKGGAYPTLDAAKAGGAVTVNYGLFINAVIRFVIVAFAIFILVKQINRLARHEEAAAPPPEPSRQEVLLEEIRDLLKARA